MVSNKEFEKIVDREAADIVGDGNVEQVSLFLPLPSFPSFPSFLTPSL